MGKYFGGQILDSPLNTDVMILHDVGLDTADGWDDGSSLLLE